MFENSADSDPLTNIFCGVSSLNWSYFRARPAEATSTGIDVENLLFQVTNMSQQNPRPHLHRGCPHPQVLLDPLLKLKQLSPRRKRVRLGLLLQLLVRS